MSPLVRIFDMARAAPRHIILSEGNDKRIHAAAVQAVARRLARVTLLGDPSIIAPALSTLGAPEGSVGIIDPRDASDLDEVADFLHSIRAAKGMTALEARRAIVEPLLHAAVRVRIGHADGTVGGAANTTADVVRAALRAIGPAAGISTVSSCFLMTCDRELAPISGGAIFADCGLVVAPDARQLADIALAAAATCRALLGEEPRVALLSFSTSGSAEHPSLAIIRDALRAVRERDPGLEIDGEIQFDAALDNHVRAMKAPASRLKGQPNVYIFPDLASGNIGYKIAQRLGGLGAVGPILQGLALPANDLSRGCSIDDVVAMIAITAAQATRAAPA